VVSAQLGRYQPILPCASAQKIDIYQAIVADTHMTWSFGVNNMNEIRKLANQHFLEWESRLKHIDEMMAKAQEVHVREGEGSNIHTQLTKIRVARDELALATSRARSLPEDERPAMTNEVEGIQAAFSEVGLQMEKLLATVLGVK